MQPVARWAALFYNMFIISLVICNDSLLTRRGIILVKMKNYYEIENNIIYIYCRKGVVIADKKMMGILRNYTWYVDVTGYAATGGGKRCKFRSRMHSLIMGKKKNFLLDHINRNRLDNRKSNLRFVTSRENCLNKNYRGYHYSKLWRAWIVQMRYNGTRFNFGSFKTEEEAKRKRLEMEQLFFPGLKFHSTKLR